MCDEKTSMNIKKRWLTIRIKMLGHQDISRLCSEKMVATPHSGYEPREFLQLWLDLDQDNQNTLVNTYKKGYGWTLGVFVYKDENGNIPCNPFCGNIIIFYIVEYLKLLSKASDKSTDELLGIFAIMQTQPYEKDLIKIAFGDIFGKTYDKTPLVTKKGEEVLKKYIDLQSSNLKIIH
jgi:hypothetical protein